VSKYYRADWILRTRHIGNFAYSDFCGASVNLKIHMKKTPLEIDSYHALRFIVFIETDDSFRRLMEFGKALDIKTWIEVEQREYDEAQVPSLLDASRLSVTTGDFSVIDNLYLYALRNEQRDQ
jgi:hypothetical protein